MSETTLQITEIKELKEKNCHPAGTEGLLL